MTIWSGRILRALAERYPSSAAADGGRNLRLRASSIFPGFERARADERESFLEGAEALERDGIVSLVWEGRRIGESLSAVILQDSAALFARLGLRSPSDECARARTAARDAAKEHRARGEAREALLFEWMAESIAPTDIEAGLSRDVIEKLSRLSTTVLNDDGKNTHSPRALSVSIFSDSKEIERLLALCDRILKRARGAGIEIPDFSLLERRYSDVTVAGCLRFVLDDGSSLDNGAALDLGFPLSSARRVRRIEVIAPHSGDASVLGVENKESFFAFAARLRAGGLPGIDALVYVGGHVNPAVAALFSAFARSSFRLRHAGDLDPDGILILQELCQVSGRPVEPYFMDAETFDRYLPLARELDANVLKRVAMIADETRALPGIDALLSRILATGRGVEQEIIA